ncbi:nucleoside-diphosphate sugar epimerase [Leptolyngbya sp. Heron Island J]|uniref:SDR family oxidoreductase n=1 Tax=Leptolyngbya sp. Heron Island J TaxID=1385935 RepID=UPI0003B9B1F4|nr:SDR family oxidoreductase [Leptolyngbya sp. Heron Island J]ESA37199.1 nucleoside-diphosphate sugar epimerase [Leptolyngbya sp. Heron Island J]
MSILVVGATGTLGRQIVRNALDEGFDVKCLVRNFQKAAFLREWGAQLVQANICGPKSLPPCFDDVTAVIDAATARPQDSVYDVDWDGKVNLIKAALDANVERYVFISILNCEQYPHVPLMDVKHCTEKFLEESGINYTILRPCGFLQGLVGQYAVPILEKQAIWVMGEAAPIAYMNTQDIARFAVRSLKLPETNKRSFPLAGTRAWGGYELVRLCERLSGETAKVSTMSLGLLRGVRSFANFFQWGWQFADRLAFAEVSAGSAPLDAEMDEVYSTFGLDKSEITTVEEYLGEYFNRILKKLKELNFESNRESKKKLPF